MNALLILQDKIKELESENQQYRDVQLANYEYVKELKSEIEVLQEKGQYFHDFCHKLGIPNGVMPYRVDWLRNYIKKLRSALERIDSGKCITGASWSEARDTLAE